MSEASELKKSLKIIEDNYINLSAALKRGKKEETEDEKVYYTACCIYHLMVIAALTMEYDYPKEAKATAEKYQVSLDGYTFLKENEDLYTCVTTLRELSKQALTPEDMKTLYYMTLANTSELMLGLAIDGWEKYYRMLMKNLFKTDVEFIKAKEKIKVAFFMPSATYFSCESIYRMFEADPRYEPYLVLIFHYQDLMVEKKEDSIKFFVDMCEYFKNLDFKYIVAYDPVTDVALGYEDIGSPDIIFHTFPYTERYYERKLCLDHIPINTLNVYIPYGVQVLNYFERTINTHIHRVAFKLYYETAIHREQAAKHSVMGTDNVVISGYVKMDASYEQPLVLKQGEGFVWKNAGKPLYKIIYAPHHTLTNTITSSSTFHINSEFFYNLAKATPQISWVIKPHPNLRVRSVAWGLYKSVEEYDAYMNRWNELPNAIAVQDRPYQDIFASSDAMVFDSISFMTEYIYYHKPSLFLTRNTNDFNELGKMILSVLYTADGTDRKAIAAFLQDVVFGGNDYKKEEREKFFSEYLDYKTINGKLAAETIYDDITSYFESR